VQKIGSHLLTTFEEKREGVIAVLGCRTKEWNPMKHNRRFRLVLRDHLEEHEDGQENGSGKRTSWPSTFRRIARTGMFRHARRTSRAVLRDCR
jgi:hypothetical protein